MKTPNPTPSPTTSSPTTTAFATCGKLNDRKCKKATDCSWFQKYCYVTADLPTLKPTTADFHQCGRLSKSRCSRSRSCIYSKEMKECIVKTASPTAPTLPSGAPTTPPPTTGHELHCSNILLQRSGRGKCKKSKYCRLDGNKCIPDENAPLPTPKPTPKPTAPTPSPTFPPVPDAKTMKDYLVQAPTKEKDNKCAYPDQSFIPREYAIICCDQDGNGQRPVIGGSDCPLTAQWYIAKFACQTAGLRLCSPEEILLVEDDCHRAKKAWTSEVCEGAEKPPTDAPSTSPTLSPSTPTMPPSSCDGLTREGRQAACNAVYKNYRGCKNVVNSGISCQWRSKRCKTVHC